MLGRRKDIPESGEYDRPVVFYRRVDMPSTDCRAKQVDTEIFRCFCHLQPISTLVYYTNTQVSNKATHYLYVDLVPGKTDPQTLCHGAIAKMLDEDLTYRVLRPMILKNNFTIRYEVIELGTDKPEGPESTLVEEVFNG